MWCHSADTEPNLLPPSHLAAQEPVFDETELATCERKAGTGKSDFRLFRTSHTMQHLDREKA